MPRRASSGTFASGPLLLRDAALLTDLYELTMAAAFFRQDMTETATFSLFVRRLPPERNFLVAAGLEDVLEYLRGFRFSPDALGYLRSLARFDAAFLRYLGALRFTGEVRAVREGTVLFADEPLLEVRGPVIEAQLVETALLNLCHVQTVLASKAARAVIAAGGRPLAEFGLRRSHGTDAGMKAARSSYLAGIELTSNVLAGREYGIPLTGTMAHSYVTAFTDELQSFRAYAAAFPDSAVLLLDSYDTIAGAHKAVEVARELRARGHHLAGVRLDSGDLVVLSRAVRRSLDVAGVPDVPWLARGGVDELDIARILAAGAPVDAFGIGTRLNVSADAPSLDVVYKLVRYGGRDLLKLSPGKETWPGEKAIYRLRDAAGRMSHDVLALREEPPPPGAQPLLETVMRGGEPVGPHPALADLRRHCAEQLAALPEKLRSLAPAPPYPVEPSPALQARQREVTRAVRSNQPS
jgi:nicotinate phosphoribosyltransferase